MTLVTENIEVPEGMSMLSIADPSGDTRLMWAPGNADDVAAAKAAFDTAKGKGMLAYAVDAMSGERTGEVIREFDPQAGKLIMMTRQTAGG